MKKIALFTVGAICLSYFSNAQITKGSTFLGGSIGYSKDKSERISPPQTDPVQETDQYAWNIRPQIGKVIAGNQVFGVFLDFSKNNSEQKNGMNKIENEATNYGGGFFYRRYYPFSQRFYLFGEVDLSVHFGNGKTTNKNGTTWHVPSKTKLAQVGVFLMPGISFAASRKLFLETSLNNLLSIFYSANETKTYNTQGTLFQTTKDKSFGANINATGTLGLAIGLRWILPSGK